MGNKEYLQVLELGILAAQNNYYMFENVNGYEYIEIYKVKQNAQCL